ncbi:MULTISPECIES: methyltransferase [unclassified Bradyrhizobium]|uniref:methyltransferase n=1 Tax=unclassified Bradyrhizobium TaxID=2631580 RepID=UPI001FFAA6FB|nr:MULTISPECIES: methyltransferase [unclassified Bradyrhizobium]
MRYPALTATILERPPIDQPCAERPTERKLYPDRARVIAGDMFVDPLPRDASLHLYSHVLHNWGSDKVRLLLNKSYDALRAGGRVAIFSCHSDDRGGHPSPAAEAEYSVVREQGSKRLSESPFSDCGWV